VDKELAELLVKMRLYKIKQKDIAEHLGITDVYLSMILNGKKNPKNFRERLSNAIDEIISATA
jgi:transcriptional regulator with XRE-family HTH domain